MKQKWVCLFFVLMCAALLCVGCFGMGSADEPMPVAGEPVPVVESGSELSVSGRGMDGEFKMTLSAVSYADKSSFDDYHKKMSWGAPDLGGAVQLSFRLDEYADAATLDPLDCYQFTFVGSDGTETAGWLSTEPVFNTFEPIAKGGTTSGWVFFDEGIPTPESIRLNFHNAADNEVAVLFTLPAASALPDPEQAEISFNTPVSANGATFTIVKMETADTVLSPYSLQGLKAMAGEKFILMKTHFTNTGSAAIDPAMVGVYFEGDDGVIYPGLSAVQKADGSINDMTVLEAGESADIYFTVSVPKETAGSGKYTLNVGEQFFSIPYTLNETQDSAEPLEVNQTISTALEDFTLDQIARNPEMNPPNKSGEYNYLSIDEEGYTFIILSGNYKNNSTEPLEVNSRVGVYVKYDGEIFDTRLSLLNEERNGFDSITTVPPGEERTVYFAAKAPLDVPSAELSVTLGTIENTYAVNGIPD